MSAGTVEPGTLGVVTRTGLFESIRVTDDAAGGLWVARADGIHHGLDGPVLSSDRADHLGTDPRTGALLYVADDDIRRLSTSGEVSTVVSNVTARWGYVSGLDGGPDGAVYFAAGPEDIHRVAPDGTITTVVDTSVYVEALTVTPIGSIIYFTRQHIERLSNGVTTTLAGIPGRYCAQPDPCGDNGPAAEATFGSVVQLAVAQDGTVLVGEYNGRIRRVRAGRVEPVAGGWVRCAEATVDCNENGVAPSALLDVVVSMALAGSDLYVVDVRNDGAGGRLLRIPDVDIVGAWDDQGYRMIAADGGVFAFGWAPFCGSTGDLRLVSPIVSGRSNGAGGYWFVAGDGGVFTFGNAPFFGSAAGMTDSPVVDMVVRADGDGYAILERDGSVLFFNRTLNIDRPDYFGVQSYVAIVQTGPEEARVVAERPSSLPRLNVPLVAAHATRSGKGTWYVASDGGVFTDGDAGFFGSTGDMRLNQPVLDLIPTPSEQGYWLVAADGGVFTFGDARFMGSMGAVRLNRPVVAGVAGPSVSG